MSVFQNYGFEPKVEAADLIDLCQSPPVLFNDLGQRLAARQDASDGIKEPLLSFFGERMLGIVSFLLGDCCRHVAFLTIEYMKYDKQTLRCEDQLPPQSGRLYL